MQPHTEAIISHSFDSRTLKLVATAMNIIVHAGFLYVYFNFVGGGILFVLYATGLVLSILSGLFAQVDLPPEDQEGTLTIRASRAGVAAHLWLLVCWSIPLAISALASVGTTPALVTAVLGLIFIIAPSAMALSLVKALASPVRLQANAEGLTIWKPRGLVRAAQKSTLPWTVLGAAQIRGECEVAQVCVSRTDGQRSLWLNLNNVATSDYAIVDALNRRIVRSRRQATA